jgi:hypothetical protein
VGRSANSKHSALECETSHPPLAFAFDGFVASLPCLTHGFPFDDLGVDKLRVVVEAEVNLQMERSVKWHVAQYAQ